MPLMRVGALPSRFVFRRDSMASVPYTDNLLLSCLPAETLAILKPLLHPMEMPVRLELFARGAQPEYGYFMRSGMASIVSTSQSGESVEVGIVGREGLVGASHLLGDGPSAQCYMQVAGTAWRCSMRDLHRIFTGQELFRTCILEYLNAQLNVLSQMVLCQRLHSVEQRLARWLLMTRDRVGSDHMELTQEFLGMMLGAQRTTVTMIAGELQRSGLIEYRRGKVWIRNGEALERSACECYQVIRDAFPRLLAEPRSVEAAGAAGDRETKAVASEV